LEWEKWGRRSGKWEKWEEGSIHTLNYFSGLAG
jgi:hypothetical protein